MKQNATESVFQLFRVKHDGRKAEAEAKGDGGGVLAKGNNGGGATAERRLGSRLPTLQYFPKHSS